VTGGLAFFVDFGLFALCLYLLDWHYLLANLVGLVAGLVLNYALSILWVFTACKRTLEKKKVAEFTLFTLVGIAGVGINQLLMYLMVDGLDLNEMLSKMVAAILVLMWNFGARKLILFKKKKEV
jgi:putative flippase GtrA